MKIRIVAILIVAATAALAEPSEALKRAYQMQEAVLKTQDLAKIGELLKQGVDPNAPIGCGTFAPLDGAVHVGNAEMLKFLLAHGAKPRGELMSVAAFYAGHQQALEMVQALAGAEADINARGELGTALTAASFRENTGLIGWLLAQKTIKKDEMDTDGFTALMWAVKKGSSEIVDQLLKAGADPSIRNQKGETAATVAQQEIELRRAMMVKFEAVRP